MIPFWTDGTCPRCVKLREGGMLVIDTHAHVFSQDEEAYPPRKNPSRPPKGTGTLERLERERSLHGVTGVCTVQVSGFYGFDNRYVCDVAREHRDWVAGVVTLDPDEPRSPEILRGLVARCGVRGMRTVPAQGGGSRRFSDDGVRALWRACGDLGLPVNAIGGHEFAEELNALAAEFPRQAVVLDHAMGLQSGADTSTILAALAGISARPNVYVKLSSIANGPVGCAQGFPCREFHDEILRVVNLFGAERCCWGSHFPLERYAKALSYAEHLAIYREVLPLTDKQRRWILGETANRLWFGGELA